MQICFHGLGARLPGMLYGREWKLLELLLPGFVSPKVLLIYPSKHSKSCACWGGSTRSFGLQQRDLWAKRLGWDCQAGRVLECHLRRLSALGSDWLRRSMRQSRSLEFKIATRVAFLESRQSIQHLRQQCRSSGTVQWRLCPVRRVRSGLSSWPSWGWRSDEPLKY